jgi:hypothetical protein
MVWRLAKSLEQLRSQANALWPNRSKASDGTIGDAAHAASASDHNPNDLGVVCAFDLTYDPANDVDCAAIAEAVRTNPHPDLKYLIWDHRMFSAYARAPYAPFEWRPYTGADPHTNHIHFSVGVGTDGRSVEPYDDETPWTLTAPAPSPPALQEDDDMAKQQNGVDALGRTWVFTILADGSLQYRVIGSDRSVSLPGKWKHISPPVFTASKDDHGPLALIDVYGIGTDDKPYGLHDDGRAWSTAPFGL